MRDYISISSTEKVAQRVEEQRKSTYQFFLNRYAEFLPLMINYHGLDGTLISPLVVENMLRQGVGVAIGQTTTGKTAVLGYITKDRTLNYQGINSFTQLPCTKGDINFIIDKTLQLPDYKEMTFHDGYISGNMVILYNKPFTLINDYQVVAMYADKLAEIALSRYSLYMQAKVSHVIKGEADDQDTERIANDLLNGKPFIKTTDYFDAEDNVVSINDIANLVSALPELKREYQNNIAELNSILGLNSLGVDKESGVSDIEAQSNASFKKANESIYLKARNEPLKHYNAKFGTELQAEFNDLMVSELSSLEKLEMVKQ